MPAGQKIISWTPENETKLFYAILALHNVKVDFAACAKMFGPDVPASVIQSHMKHLRAKAAKMGIITTKRTLQAQATHLSTSPAKKPTNKKRSKAKDMSDDSDDDDKEEGFSDATVNFSETSVEEDSVSRPSKAKENKTIGGRVTKVRNSPRKVLRADYKTLMDPFPKDEDILIKAEEV